MAELKRIPGFERRFWTRVLSAQIAVFGVMYFCIWMSNKTGASQIWTWLSISCVFLMFVALWRTAGVSLNRFHCPTCGEHLPWNEEPRPSNISAKEWWWRKRGETIRFLCVKCDTLWDTNIGGGD